MINRTETTYPQKPWRKTVYVNSPLVKDVIVTVVSLRLDWGLGSGRRTFQSDQDGTLRRHNIPISYPTGLDVFGNSFLAQECILFF